MEHILITGGAGFIGSHTADLLLKQGHKIRVLDSLTPQIHEGRKRPAYLSPEVELQIGDVCDPEAVAKALDGITAVYHLAAETGVGQSMYEVKLHYTTNVVGTAVLWQEIQKLKNGLKRVVLSSSRAVYGEGAYVCPNCGLMFPEPRKVEDMLRSKWLPFCGKCGHELCLTPTTEFMELHPISVYGITKKFQEETCRLMGKNLHIPVTVVRYFNVYGPRQALSNPYTGIVAGFFVKLMRGEKLPLYECGLPVRDFVHVYDIAKANTLALGTPGDFDIFNVASGVSSTLEDLSITMAGVLGIAPNYEKIPRFRVGDIYGTIADITHIQKILGYQPEVSLSEGLKSILSILPKVPPKDRSAAVENELRDKNLLYN